MVVTQGVGFADVFGGMTKSKQVWPLCMPSENAALSYVLLPLRGAGVDFLGVLVLRVGRGFRPLIIADFI